MAGLDDLRLDGRVALVTGAGSTRGLGRAIAVRLASAGAQLVVGDLDEAGVRETAAMCEQDGPAALALRMDVTDETSVGAAFAAAIERYGRVDVLVNNAGISESTSAWEIDVPAFDRMLAVNLRGGFLCARAAMPGMMDRRWGRLIWISSVAGKTGGGFFGSAHYAASKAGVIGLCQGLARQLGQYGITSNAVAPGLIDTEIASRVVGEETWAAVRERVLPSVPVGRIGSAGDIAAAVHFLASEAASYVNGEIMDVNGGVYFD
ncbi:MAG: SDR family oxidoreductase [Chloroflexota bacterium]|nr:SDR family oxidoreductase [Chloroflexota bacterium]